MPGLVRRAGGVRAGRDCGKALCPLGRLHSNRNRGRGPENQRLLKAQEPRLPPSLQVMSIEEVERVLDETQEAVEYQRVGVRVCVRGARLPPPTSPEDSCQLGDCPGPPWGPAAPACGPSSR